MELICQLINLYVVVILASVLLSWFPTEPGSGLSQVRDVLYRLTEPVMGPVRRTIGASFGGIDFSPIIVILGIQLLRGILCG